MQTRSDPGCSLVLGLGEVGAPLLEVLEKAHPVTGLDIDPGGVEGPVEFLHVCYPFEIADFCRVTADYAGRYSPEYVVIHSTVPVGTTSQIDGLVPMPVLHSPVRGKHTKMAEELLRYVKFVAGREAAAVARYQQYMEKAGFKTKTMASPESTEIAKLTETTYFGLQIAFAQDVDRMTRKYSVDYDEVLSFFDEIEYLPPVKFFPGVIGGHCVMPNIALLKRTFESSLLDAIDWSNDLREKDGVE